MKKIFKITIITVAVLIVIALLVAAGILIAVTPILTPDHCPNGENYQPCYCRYSSNGEYDVDCTRVLIDDVVNVFQRTTPSRLRTFTFYLSPFDASNDSMITIPSDLLHKHYVTDQIQLKNPNNSYSLRIEPEAFRSSRDFIEGVYFQDCDANRLNFHFLSGCDNLSKLQINYATNVHLANWTSLPPLPKLKTLSISSSTGLNDWETFPSLIRGLETLDLFNNAIQNLPMDRILNWTVGHSSSTLQNLWLSYNDLTNVPRQILSFTSLKTVGITNQKTGIPLIPFGSVKFAGPFSYFSAVGDQIVTIETGAFQGNFSGAYVDLSSNNLTRFEEMVFKEMLQQMVNQTPGSLYAFGNPFDCESDPCHLTWLIRDNRDLLTPVNAFCSNGTYFEDLNPSGFSSCDITAPASNSTTPVASYGDDASF